MPRSVFDAVSAYFKNHRQQMKRYDVYIGNIFESSSRTFDPDIIYRELNN